ncbi:hypothetical protein RCL1_003699 [Eukaryota sp. TZLM3-RCL]
MTDEPPHVFFQFMDSSKRHKNPPVIPRFCCVSFHKFECIAEFDSADTSHLSLSCSLNSHNRCWTSKVSHQPVNALSPLGGVLTFNYFHSVFPPGDFLELSLFHTRKKPCIQKSKRTRVVAKKSFPLIHAVQMPFNGSLILTDTNTNEPVAKVYISVLSSPILGPKGIPHDLSLVPIQSTCNDSDLDDEKDEEVCVSERYRGVAQPSMSSPLSERLLGIYSNLKVTDSGNESMLLNK